jgi:tRNA pseudouridine13 synthase
VHPLCPEPLSIAADLPGIGGRIKVEPEDFVVEELAAYDPTGAGEHLLLWLEKRALSTDELVRRVARSLEVSAQEVGTAGLKDTWAVARQWVSVPARAAPRLAALDALDAAGVKLLASHRHDTKLRTGQLAGNRFDVLVRDVSADAVARATAVLEHLRRTGLPNYYGAQRFGRDGQTVRLGTSLLCGEPAGELDRAPPGRRGFLRRLALSSVQSALFNLALADRIRDHLFGRVLAGDVVARRGGSSHWVVADVSSEQARVDSHETVVTGPMFGPTMRAPRGDVLARESAVLDRAGLTREHFTRFAKLTAGTRRAYWVWLDGVEVVPEAAGLRLRFTLPAGTYATVLLAEVTKVAPAAADPRDGESEPETPCDP